MKNDLGFVVTTAAAVEIPFTVQGVAQGREPLMQRVVTLMLTDPADPLRPGGGGGLYSTLRGANVSEGSLDRVRNLVSIAVANTAELIKGEQDGDLSLEDYERLASLSLKDAAVPMPGHLALSFNIITADGAELLAELGLDDI